MLQFLKNKPAFLFLLPVFFVLHGYTRNYNAIAAGDALLLVMLFTAAAFIIAGACWLYYRDITKAGVLTFFVIVFQFFFGNLQNGLTAFFPGTVVTQYRFLLPATLLLFLFIAIKLKKRKKTLLQFNSYLNTLLLILVIVDAGWLLAKMNSTANYLLVNKTMKGLAIPASANKPDIYLLVMDQYAGNTALTKIFHYDNTGFENELYRRGFYVAKHSRSNYNLTPFSIASTLSMNYLAPETVQKKQLDVGYSYQVIRNSSVIKFLTGNGYRFYNYSVFDFPGQPAHAFKAFLPYGTKLVTASTFTGRLVRDIRSSIVERKFGPESIRKKIAYEYLHFNDSIFKFTMNAASGKEGVPKFVYAHFMLPHFPYYFDSKGNAVPFNKLTAFHETNSTDYIEYLQYGNKRIQELIDHLLAASPDPPIILLLSDHGFRNPDKKEDRKYDFFNLNAVYLPGGDYSQFYDSISSVNQFRVLFNTCFGQRLSILKDSTIDLWD